jgi:hypothetical protein
VVDGTPNTHQTMEDPTSFDLNQAIRNWRGPLRHSAHLREEDLAELEAHVRDSVTALQAKGLSQEECFLLATRRLGKPAALDPEFAKVNLAEVWLNRLLWMLIGLQVWGVITTVSKFLTNAVVVGGWWGLGFPTPSSQWGLSWSRAVVPATLMSVVHLLLLGGILVGLWRIIRRNEMDANDFLARALRRPVLLGAGAVLLLLVLSAIAPVEQMLMWRRSSPPEMGAISLCQALSGWLFRLAETLGFVVLTIALLRRRFRTMSSASSERQPSLLHP